MPELIDVAPGSPEWLAARRTGITATDIPVIAGLSSWESPYSLFHRKLGNLPEVPDSPRFALGRYLEPYVKTLWSCSTLGTDHEPNRTYGSGLYRSDERPWQMATVDCVLASATDLTGVLELKTWADADRDRWHDTPPLAVRAQVLWQMDVMGVATGHVACLFLPSGELASYVIEHAGGHACDSAGCDLCSNCLVCEDQRALRLAGSEFYARLQKGEAPSVDGSAATLAALKARYQPRPGKTAVIEPQLWWDYLNEKNIVAAHEEAAMICQAEIRARAEDCGDIEVAGEIVARFDRRGALRRVKAKEEDNGTNQDV